MERPRRTAILGAAALIGPDLSPIEDAVIVIEGEVIAYAGPSTGAPPLENAELVTASGMLLLPGFIDAHVHIGFFDPALVLAGGVTTARDLGWPPDSIWPLVERSRAHDFNGPALVAAGPILTVKGGYPTRAAWAPPGTGAVVGSPDDARVAVETTRARGAAIIKVALNPIAGPTLDPATLEAIVVAAHGFGLRVTAHVYGLDELDKAIVAGVDELAHMLMSPEQIPDATLAEMARRRMLIVPTLAIRSGSDRQFAVTNLRGWLALGGRVVYGTDLGNEGVEPGIDANEVDLMARAGMTPREIVASATVNAARWLGLESKGALRAGADADVIAVPEKAGDDPQALADVRKVWRAGLERR